MRHAAYAVAFFVALPLGAQQFDTLVKNAGAPLHAGVARLVSDVTIGGGDATNDEYLFSSISQLLAAKDGSVWVIDGRFPNGKYMIRRYDAAGKFIRQVGRRGDGPGEWYSPSLFAQLRDGRVILRDAVVGRPLIFYKPNGDYDTSWPYQTFTVHSVWVDTSDLIWMRRQAGATLHSASPLLTVRLRLNGAIVDTIFEPPFTRFERASFTVTNERGSSSGVAPPYQKFGLGAWSPFGYYARGVSSRYAVDVLLPPTLPNGTTRPWRPGDRVMSIRRSVPEVVVTNEERSDQVAFMNAKADAFGKERSGKIPEVPRVKQPLRSISFDLEGRVWVGVSQPSERFDPRPAEPPPGRPPAPVIKWREPLAYDLFEPSGIHIGRVALPFGVRLSDASLVQARRDIVWGVATDDDGVESVVRYRIVWP